MSTMIEFENVSRIYKSGDHELKALDNLSLKIDKGEFVVILGPYFRAIRCRKIHLIEFARWFGHCYKWKDNS